MNELPRTAAWRHLGVRDGFEVLFLRRGQEGFELNGYSTAVEDGQAWGTSYALRLDAGWRTRSAHIVGHSKQGANEVLIECDATGHWTVDGQAAQLLDGCVDVDLEASAFTNALPVNRLGLEVGQRADAPAAYVRALDLRVERLEQEYTRLPDDGEGSRYDYRAPRFDFACVLVYDESGLVLDYPGIAVRVSVG
jgi:uncharacterized protein